jgi:signal transduction histidine kinase
MLISVQEKVRRRGIWHGEAKLLRKDNSKFDARMVATNVLGADDNPAGMVLVIRDVSAAKRLEDQKSRFIATASHELRTPITNVKTRLYLIEKQPEKLQDHLEVISSVTDRMQKLVEDLLDISRFENGAIILNHLEVVLQDMIEDVIKVQAPEATDKGLNILADMPTEAIYVRVDQSRMTQVITNLITNAIHYTPEDGEITITLTTEEEIQQNIRHYYAVIKVRDTGIGISQDALDNVFKPFFRVNEYQSGAGLGLSIAKEIVKLHEAEIMVESEEGVGTCFTVKLEISSSDPITDRRE